MGIQYKQLADGSAGLEGTALDNGAFVFISIPFLAGAAATISGPMLGRALQVQSITCVVDALATNAVTATIVKAASGVALTAGTAMHAGTFNAQGTVNTNQALTMLTTAGVATIPAGSRVGINFSGVPGAAGAGSVTLACTIV